MQDIIFDTVSDETTILAIGSLFRRGDNKQWGVNPGRDREHFVKN